jgi:hypothetical protein
MTKIYNNFQELLDVSNTQQFFDFEDKKQVSQEKKDSFKLPSVEEMQKLYEEHKKQLEKEKLKEESEKEEYNEFEESQKMGGVTRKHIQYAKNKKFVQDMLEAIRSSKLKDNNAGVFS